MIQEIITYIIIILAFSYTIYSFVGFLLPGKRKKTYGCSGSCGNCTLHNKIPANINVSKIKL